MRWLIIAAIIALLAPTVKGSEGTQPLTLLERPTADPNTTPTLAENTPTSTQLAAIGSNAYLPLVIRAIPQNTIYVRSWRTFPRSASLYVVGEVVNGTANPVNFVKVIGKFYDSGGQLVATDDSYAFISAILPGNRSPFRLILSNAPAGIVRIDLTLTWDVDTLFEYRQATILSQQVRDNFGVEVFGELRNDQVVELRSIETVVTFYDAGGSVLDVDFGFPSVTTLAPGATSPYSMSTFSAIPYASYTVQAQGYLPP